jgi:tetratricopeptide (TPR) repeat protein
VLEGSVQRAGNRVRLNVQLIDAQTDGHLWAETYSKDLTDVFALQAALTQEIAAALKANLTAGERILIERRPTENQQAYDLYLRARILDQTLQIFSSKEEYERVVTLYQQAADLDPGFTLAHVQASISHGTMFWFAALDPTPGRRALAQAALEKARALAPGSPEVRLAQGSFAYACNNDWQGALDEYRAAEAGLPNDAQLQYRMALALRRLGDYGEALARLERCATLNPSDTRGISTLIETLMGLRRYRPVLAAFDRYRPLFAEDYQIARYRLLAQSELTGDWSAFLRGVANLPPRASDRFGLDAAYNLALYQGKLAEAERILLDPRLQTVPGLGGTVNEPVALHRAQLAWLSGQPDAAARFADEAIADYRGRTWSVRQQPAVQLGIARAEALAGRTAAALREGRAALAAQEKLDRWSYPYIRHGLGQVMIITGRTEEALENLRVIMDGFGLMTAAEFRHDPIWARLKSDPRFEEILKSAKPL